MRHISVIMIMLNTTLMYATNVSGSWGTTTLDSENTVGQYTSIAVGTSGAVYISYYDNTNTALKYAVNPTHTAVTGAASGSARSGGYPRRHGKRHGASYYGIFQYGLTSGSYTGTSSTQSVSGTSDTAVSIALSGLSAPARPTTTVWRISIIPILCTAARRRLPPLRRRVRTDPYPRET